MTDNGNHLPDFPVGTEYGDFDSCITGSSYYGDKYDPKYGKLNSKTCYYPTNADYQNHPWIQIDFKTELWINSVTLQNRADCQSEYVTKFRVLKSHDGENFLNVCEFKGLENGVTTVKRYFPAPVNARYMRIQVLEFNSRPSLRFDFNYVLPSQFKIYNNI